MEHLWNNFYYPWHTCNLPSKCTYVGNITSLSICGHRRELQPLKFKFIHLCIYGKEVREWHLNVTSNFLLIGVFEMFGEALGDVQIRVKPNGQSSVLGCLLLISFSRPLLPIFLFLYPARATQSARPWEGAETSWWEQTLVDQESRDPAM